MSTNNTDQAYDVMLASSDGLDLGLMLARPIGDQGVEGPKLWEVGEIPTPTNIRVSDAGVGVSDRPPEMEAVIFRADNSGGMGARTIGNNETTYMAGVVATSTLRKIIKPPGNVELTLPTSEGDVRVMIEFEDALYVSDGRYLHRSTDGSTFTQVMDAGASNRISDAVVYGAADGDTGIVVAVEVSATEVADDHWYSTDGTTFQQVTSDASRKYNYFFVQDKTLFGLENPNEYRTTTDPFVATPTWSGTTEVGDEAHNFRWGVVVAAVLVIAKEDRIFTVNASGSVSTLVAQFAPTAGPRNFPSFAIGSNSNLYFMVDAEVWEYEPVSGNLRPLGLSRLYDGQLDTTFAGNLGLAYDMEGALFTTHFTNLTLSGVTTAGASLVRVTFSDTERDAYQLPKAVFERWMQQSTNGYRPRGPYHFTRSFSTLNTGRQLYCGSDTAGKILRVDIWRATDPTIDSKSSYDSVDSVYRSGWMDHNFPALTKDYTAVLLDLTSLSGNIPGTRVSAYYYLDGDLSTRTAIAENISSSGLKELEVSGVSGRSFLLELVLIADSDTLTPEVLSWSVVAAVKFDFREVITLGVKVGDHLQNRRGNEGEYTASDIRDRLLSMRETSGTTISYDDYRGYAFNNIRILPGWQEKDVLDENGQLADYTILTIKVMRVSERTTGAFIVGQSKVAGPDLVVD